MSTVSEITIRLDDRGHYTVHQGELFCPDLTHDEALACAAAWLYGPNRAAPYLRTYAQWHAEQGRWGNVELEQSPLALTDQRVSDERYQPPVTRTYLVSQKRFRL